MGSVRAWWSCGMDVGWVEEERWMAEDGRGKGEGDRGKWLDGGRMGDDE